MTVHGDAPDLEALVTNLVSNALKFTPDGGWVRCVLDVVAGTARIVVSDNGLGIPKGEQRDLFTRFFRSSTAQAYEIQGSGLGLAIVHAIACSHGGDVGGRLRAPPGLVLHRGPAVAGRPRGGRAAAGRRLTPPRRSTSAGCGAARV